TSRKALRPERHSESRPSPRYRRGGACPRSLEGMTMSTTKTLAPTSPTTKSVRDKHKEFIFPAMIQYYAEPIVFTEGKGLRIRDADGNEYLDFFGGILTVSVGHANDKVNAAIKAQVDRFSHVSTLYPTLPVVDLAERPARL